MKKNTIRIVLALVLVLSICFATAVPATADDDNDGRVASFANGAGECTYEGTGNPDDFPWNLDWHGSFRFHVQEAHHGQPAKGWCYSVWIQDDLPYSMWILERLVDVSIVRGNETWMMYEIVASSEPSYVGTIRIAGALDGGTPGQNGDMIFSALYPYDFFPGMTAEEVYQLGIDGYLPWLAQVTKGNIIVKP